MSNEEKKEDVAPLDFGDVGDMIEVSNEKVSSDFDNQKEASLKIEDVQEKKQDVPKKAQVKKQKQPQAKKTALPTQKKRTVVTEDVITIAPPVKMTGEREVTGVSDTTSTHMDSTIPVKGASFGGNGISVSRWS